MKMNRCSIVIILVFALLVSDGILNLVDAVRADEVENLLINGDFEAGTAEWSLELRQGAVAEMTIDKNESIKGNQSLFVNIDKISGTDIGVMLRQLYSIEKSGKEYTLCVWAKCEEKATRKILQVIQEAGDPWASYSRQSFDINDEWKEYWMTFTAPVDTLVRIDIRLGMSAEDVWLDNIRFYEGEYVEEEEEEIGQAVLPGASNLFTTWARIKAQD